MKWKLYVDFFVVFCSWTAEVSCNDVDRIKSSCENIFNDCISSRHRFSKCFKKNDNDGTTRSETNFRFLTEKLLRQWRAVIYFEYEQKISFQPSDTWYLNISRFLFSEIRFLLEIKGFYMFWHIYLHKRKKDDLWLKPGGFFKQTRLRKNKSFETVVA